jgi:hypothetical protein
MQRAKINQYIKQSPTIQPFKHQAILKRSGSSLLTSTMMPFSNACTCMLVASMLCLLCSHLQVVESMPLTMEHVSLASAEGVPALGRGFSVSGNTFHSECLDIAANHTGVLDSYNYDCK